MLLVLFNFIAKLPLPLLHAVGRAAGTVMYLFPGRYRIRLDRNARQAGYTSPAFARRASGETGAMTLETPKVWLQHQRCLEMTVSHDDDVVARALDENRGILYLTPHL